MGKGKRILAASVLAVATSGLVAGLWIYGPSAPATQSPAGASHVVAGGGWSFSPD
jgi:hypothetical protein